MNNKIKSKMKVEKNIKPPKKALRKTDVMAMLLSDDDAGVIAVNIASNVEPKLTTQEESFFIAGFTECVKYFRMQAKGN